MLQKASRGPVTDAAILHYLHETLGIRASLGPWTDAGRLPYFLQEAFVVRRLSLHGHDLLLALDQRPHPPKLAELRTQVERLQAAAQMPVIYVTDAIPSFERKRLVEQHMPFLVPGNQLYLPDLGIDLREYFRTPRAEAGETLSPATQAVLITLLLSEAWRSDWMLAEIVERLGYTAMTLTRVQRELAAAGLADVSQRGRARHLHSDTAPQEIWARARKVMRSPVKRSIWVQTTAGDTPQLPVAGLSALARLTQIADPPWPVYAIGPTEWRVAKLDRPQLLPQPDDGCVEWQLWTYSPVLTRDTHTVDPLSLTLSLTQDGDERVQMALDELQKYFPW